jgi:gluconokinase
MPQYILGVDIGTGSTKAVAVDHAGKILYSTRAGYPTLQPKPGYSEQAPELIWQAFIKCIRRTTEQLGNPTAISLSSAMHSVLPVDNSGNPIMNLILWSDNRSASIAEKIKNSASGEMLYEQTGTPIHAMSPLCKINWLKENDPSTFSRTSKFISVKEYIWFKLFGVYEIDHSIASATGLFDIEMLTWNNNALTLSDLKPTQLSLPVSTSHTRELPDADLASILGISPKTTFVIGASDGCLANVGSSATSPEVAALTIGTSGAIRVTRSKPVFNFEAMPFNYRLDENTFVSGGPINNGGVVLKWYAENFLGVSLASEDDYGKLLGSINEIPAGSEGLLFLPYILGERAPIWNSDACGVFFGITARHRQPHFTRAIIESISFALYQVFLSLENNKAITQINVSGGFVNSSEWVQTLADVFGKKICLINSEDASAIGAVFLAMKALGMINSYETMSSNESTLFTPRPDNHTRYTEDVFPQYERLYKLLKTEMTNSSHRKNINLTTTN